MIQASREWLEAYKREGAALGVDVRAVLRECVECKWYGATPPQHSGGITCGHHLSRHSHDPVHYLAVNARSDDYGLRRQGDGWCGPSGRFWEPK